MPVVFYSAAWADDVDDVRAFIDRYAEPEGNLEAQADMIRDDRIMIAGGMRQTDQAANMAMQQAQRDQATKINGGAAKWVMRTEGSIVRVYGNTAVASFVRLTNIFPPNAMTINAAPLWVTLVLVKEGGDWGIAHTHLVPRAQQLESLAAAGVYRPLFFARATC